MYTRTYTGKNIKAQHRLHSLTAFIVLGLGMDTRCMVNEEMVSIASGAVNLYCFFRNLAFSVFCITFMILHNHCDARNGSCTGVLACSFFQS